MANEASKIWFITGISSGLGKALAEAVLQQGDVLIGSFRNQQQVDEFNARTTENGLAVLLDITQGDQINEVVHDVLSRFGRIDVLVNNAGYGLIGAVEEATEEEIRAIFETNFFGTMALTRAFLPFFRKQKKGHIIQISSHGGVKAFAGFGLYNASKFALEGASEALAAEIAPLGVALTLVEPGPFRTNFAGGSLRQTATHIADYDTTAGAFLDRMQQVNGQQEGDPAKAANAIVKLTRIDKPPLRLPLGKIALATITAKLQSMQADLDSGRAVAENAVYAPLTGC
ncbi:oxidoreductase [Spirosoma linguale]|uniref:Short-chain dehydrogenase/reductase SDR n=1 Tax=Spirosoma linguale (strain ATCC 33905 / DSM 74 / LMG 10896 / Claus 1) TaxID=504472 RepID=D2QGL4_SPILD|nr:short-chain dehydrogenase/reductase SDR [Spirosoma linguale DSM 74]